MTRECFDILLESRQFKSEEELIIYFIGPYLVNKIQLQDIQNFLMNEVQFGNEFTKEKIDRILKGIEDLKYE